MKNLFLPLTLLMSLGAHAFSWDDLSKSTSDSDSLQARLTNSMNKVFKSLGKDGPVVRSGIGYGLPSAQGSVGLECLESSHSVLAVQEYRCSAKNVDQNVLRGLMTVLREEGKQTRQGRNYGFTLEASNATLTCLYSGRSMVVECRFGSGKPQF